MNDAAALPSLARARARAHVSHARRRRLFYRHWPATATARRAAPSCCSIAATSIRRRMAHLVDELDLPDFDFFAWDARGHGRSPGARGDSAGHRRVGARRADVRRPHRAAHGFAVEDIGVDRAERGRRAGRGVGARLRAAASAAWCSPRRRSRSSCTCRSRAPGLRLDAQAARQLLRQQLREGEVPDARSRAHRELRRRSADHAADLGQRAARPVRCRRARRRRRAGDRRAHAAADLRRRLGRPSRRRSTRSSTGWDRRSRSATCCPASITTRWASAIARTPIAQRARRSCCACSRSRSRRPDLRDADQGGFTREESDALAAPLPAAVAARALLGRRRARACGSAARCPKACALGHATGFDSGSTLDYVYRNQPTRRHAARTARSIATISTRSAGAASASARCTSRNCCGMAMADRRAAGAARAHRRHRGRPRPLRARGARPLPARAPDSILLRDYSELNVEQGSALIRHEALEHDRDVRARRRLRPREPRRDRAAPDDRHRVRTLRALPRQRAGARVARRAGRRDRAAAVCWSTPASRGIRSSS